MEKTAFVISPIGKEGSPTRARADKVLKYLIEAAVSTKGYSAQRADDIMRPGIITTQVIEKLIDAPLVIADLTERNPNVFYELAIRHAAQKPVIQIMEAEQPNEIPFDIAAMRVILFRMDDVVRFEDAKREIIGHIDQIEAEPGKATDSPVKSALLIASIARSSEGENMSKEISDALHDIRNMLVTFAERAMIGTEHMKVMYERQRAELQDILRSRSAPMTYHPAWGELFHLISKLLGTEAVRKDREASRVAVDIAGISEYVIRSFLEDPRMMPLIEHIRRAYESPALTDYEEARLPPLPTLPPPPAPKQGRPPEKRVTQPGD